MRTILYVLLVSAVAVGCKKKTEEVGGMMGDKGDKAKGPAITYPALTAEAEPAPITAAETPPLDSVKFRMTDKRGDTGWPEFDAYNVGLKEISFMAISGYAYDKDGKQVMRTGTSLSWNGKLGPGAKSDWGIKVGGFGEAVPATAASYELCYTSVQFTGDAKSVDDNSRCPDQKPKKK
jgi:hypothetical protein